MWPALSLSIRIPLEIMDNFDNGEILKEANQMLARLLRENLGNLNAHSQKAIAHYIHHDEYEMAFEGIFIDLMEAGRISSDRNLEEYEQLGKKLNLDKESVFDGDFWDKFVRFIESS